MIDLIKKDNSTCICGCGWVCVFTSSVVLYRKHFFFLLNECQSNEWNNEMKQSSINNAINLHTVANAATITVTSIAVTMQSLMPLLRAISIKTAKQQNKFCNPSHKFTQSSKKISSTTLFCIPKVKKKINVKKCHILFYLSRSITNSFLFFFCFFSLCLVIRICKRLLWLYHVLDLCHSEQ